MKKQNLSLLCDFYELTMSNGYLRKGLDRKTAYFDVFFRSVPDGGGFAIAAGLQQVMEYIEDLSFSKEDLEFLRFKGSLTKRFCGIWKASALPAIFTRCPRERRCFRTSPS
jgi:nicotinate phosphoribosyltransferase